MDTNRLQRTYYMPVGRYYWDEPLKIHLKRFKRFDRQMDRQLRKLMARWQHTAAPNTQRLRRSLDETTVF
jgi:hypothetical protein